MEPAHKQYILENLEKKSAREMAEALGIKERKVKRWIAAQPVKGTPADLGEGPEISEAPAKNFMLWASIALIILLGFAVYANSLTGQFVWDDDHLIKNNVSIRSFTYLPEIFTGHKGVGAGEEWNFYRPFQIFTYMVDYHFWGFNVVGYHLTNIVLHILVALNLYWLLFVLFKDRLLSFFTSMFYVVHPLHTVVV